MQEIEIRENDIHLSDFARKFFKKSPLWYYWTNSRAKYNCGRQKSKFSLLYQIELRSFVRYRRKA